MELLPRIPQPDEARAGAGETGFPDAPDYYGRPLLKAPHWEWNVVTYLFLGGIMGGLGLLQLVASGERESERKMRRTARLTALALAAVNPAILISHLGRPERFLHMMRIVKLKSPMSMGVWGLVAFSAFSGATAASELIDAGTLPRWLRALIPPGAAIGQAMTGLFISGYTGVLLSATANPFWASGKRHIPAFSVCSGIAGACALSGVLATASGNHGIHRKLERLEGIAGLAEFALLLDFQKRSGPYGKPMFEGARGERLRKRTLIAGIAIPALLNLAGAVVRLPKPVDEIRGLAASALTLAGAYVLRESLIEAGKDSARDPHAAFRQPT